MTGAGARGDREPTDAVQAGGGGGDGRGGDGCLKNNVRAVGNARGEKTEPGVRTHRRTPWLPPRRRWHSQAVAAEARGAASARSWAHDGKSANPLDLCADRPFLFDLSPLRKRVILSDAEQPWYPGGQTVIVGESFGLHGDKAQTRRQDTP